jgi:hypothetical protein
VNQTKRLSWVSKNEKYKVLVRKFDDHSIDVGFWKLDKFGCNKDIRFNDLPQYVKNKIEEMKSVVN